MNFFFFLHSTLNTWYLILIWLFVINFEKEKKSNFYRYNWHHWNDKNGAFNKYLQLLKYCFFFFSFSTFKIRHCCRKHSQAPLSIECWHDKTDMNNVCGMRGACCLLIPLLLMLELSYYIYRWAGKRREERWRWWDYVNDEQLWAEEFLRFEEWLEIQIHLRII